MTIPEKPRSPKQCTITRLGLEVLEKAKQGK